jgi:hypothetical protein
MTLTDSFTKAKEKTALPFPLSYTYHKAAGALTHRTGVQSRILDESIKNARNNYRRLLRPVIINV